MKSFLTNLSLASLLVCALTAPAQDGLRLVIKRSPNDTPELTYRVTEPMPDDGTAIHTFLALGLAQARIPLDADTFLGVQPLLIVPICGGGIVPPEVYAAARFATIYAQAVAMRVRPDGSTTFDGTQVIGIDDGTVTEIPPMGVLRCTLASTDSIPPQWSLHLECLVPTGGHALVIDRIERGKEATRVYVRLQRPASGTVVTQALENLRADLALGSDPGLYVAVYFSNADEAAGEEPVWDLVALMRSA